MAEPSPLTRDVGTAAKFGVGAAICGAISVAAFTNASPIAGLVFAGLAAAVGWGASKARKGACPSCGATIPADAKVKRCEKCDAYALVEGDRLAPMAADHRASSPSLQISCLRLKSPPDWTWPWADRCAVCGGAASRRLPLTVKLLTGVVGPMGRVTTWNLAVPHCGDHQNGIGFDNSAAEPMLGFRSYAHYQDFLKANRRPR